MPVVGTPTTSTTADAYSAVTAQNVYATLDAANTALGVSGQDADVMSVLDAASRAAELLCGRVFWTETGTRYFDVGNYYQLVLPDCLGVTEVAVDELEDLTYSKTLTADTEYVLQPYHAWPKTSLLMLSYGGERLVTGRRKLKVTGTWGAGDLSRQSPWHEAGVTATLASAADTTATLSVANGVAAGHTLLLDDEQVFVESVDDLEASVARGVNGTTAAAHAAEDVLIAAYPPDVTRGVLWLASEIWRAHAQAGYESERIGEYSYKLAGESASLAVRERLFGRVRRTVL
jgi:hypothetical protein